MILEERIIHCIINSPQPAYGYTSRASALASATRPRSTPSSLRAILKIMMLALLAAFLAGTRLAAAPLDDGTARLESHWAHAHYSVIGQAAQAAAFDAVIVEADALAMQFPDQAAPLVWIGIAQTAKAGTVGGIAGYKLVKAARTALEMARRIDPNAANGLGLSQLGILYYKVPGFPVAFGDREKAARYLLRALEIVPTSLAANLAYGDFLATSGRATQAVTVLKAALRLTPRQDQPLAENGRRAEIIVLLMQLSAKTASSKAKSS